MVMLKMSSFALKRSKKGFIYPALLVLMVFISVIYLALQLMDKMGGFGQIPLGEAQLAVLDAQKESDKAMLFLEQIARLSAVTAFDQLIKRGGGFVGSQCGILKRNTLTYVFWNDPKTPREPCLPDVVQGYFSFFSSRFNEVFDSQQAYSFDPSAFNFFLGNNKIAGFSYKSLEIPVVPSRSEGFDSWFVKAKDIWGTDNAIGIYYRNPAFEVAFPVFFNFLEVKRVLENILVECSGLASSAEFNSCIKEKSKVAEHQLSGSGFDTKIVTDLENAVFFDIVFKNSSPYQTEPLILRIALAKYTVETAPSPQAQ